MGKDTIADILTSIRNADMKTKRTVRIASTKISAKILKILQREGFIKHVRTAQEGKKSFFVVTLRYRRPGQDSLSLKRVSRPSLRIYSRAKHIPRILGGMGIAILSTSRGIMTDREARLEGIGGEILCYIW
uniref:Small ribosomal subunit protein uS8c n=1 Tax=Hypertelis spergulacea TaxID=764270 RepID=A0A411L8Q8_9CARY|nr:ribosomal protein S8 [Hypertelis spergulacea]